MRVVLVIASLVPTVVYLVVALRRLGYPFELEWLEGGAVEIARRVADGRSIYVRPSLHYVPYVYTPLYFWISGGLAHITGVSFLPLRLVSLCSSLGSCVLLWWIVWRETGDAVAGIVTTGLFTATYAVSGAWFDIGRVDSLALFLTLASLLAARNAHRWQGGVVLGVLVFLSFLAKQNTLIALVPVLLLLAVTRWRVGLAALATTGAFLVGSTFVLDHVTHGWYGYYVFQELIHQGAISSVWKTFFTKDLFHVPWAIGLGLVGLLVGLKERATRRTWIFWCVATGGLVVSAFISRLHSGGGENVLMPAFAATALLGGLGYEALLQRAVTITGANRPIGRRLTSTLGLVLMLAIVVQIGALHYNPDRYVPSHADLVAGQRFVALVRNTPGIVIVSNHPYYETMAGKASWAQGEAEHDVIRAGPSVARRDLLSSTSHFLHASGPATIFSDDSHYALGSYSDKYFRLTTTKVFPCNSCFYPVTDIKRRPSFRFVRR